MEEYFPRKTLRTAGNYRGKYIGKLQGLAKRPPTTFGANKDRFRFSAMGDLVEKAKIPGKLPPCLNILLAKDMIVIVMVVVGRTWSIF